MDILAATKSFEHWLSQQVGLVGGDLRYKHAAMAANPFVFLRATYYRWAQHFVELPRLICRAPTVLAVGDLHLENFGTWRDALGRLAWGINDFDEAYPLPYTHDLVRLACSAMLAIDLDHLRLSFKAACRAILDGYREGLTVGGRAFVIGEEHRWFRPILQNPAREPGRFWDRYRKLPRERASLPPPARAAIEEVLPDPSLSFDLHHRIAGLGNLGKPRYTAIAQWQGGPLAREAKALTLSAAAWAQSTSPAPHVKLPTASTLSSSKGPAPSSSKGPALRSSKEAALSSPAPSLSKWSNGPFYASILAGAIRSPDPYLQVRGPWIVRRLAPDCRRLELAALSRVKEEEWLLHAMGFETANVHLGTLGAAASIQRHLLDFPASALRKSAIAMAEALAKDLRRYRKHH